MRFILCRGIGYGQSRSLWEEVSWSSILKLSEVPALIRKVGVGISQISSTSTHGALFFATKFLPHPAPAEAKFLIGDKQRQLGTKTGLCEKANIDEEDMTDTIALSRFISLGLVHSSDAIQTAECYCYSSKGWEGLKLQMLLQDGAQKRGLTAA